MSDLAAFILRVVARAAAMETNVQWIPYLRRRTWRMVEWLERSADAYESEDAGTDGGGR